MLLSCCVLIWQAAACTPSGANPYEQFQHEDPAVRLGAVRRAGAAGDTSCAGYLVDRLTDTEPDVRFFAILALDRIAGQRLGYRYYDPPEKREQAVRRWREWLARRQAPATQPAGKED